METTQKAKIKSARDPGRIVSLAGIAALFLCSCGKAEPDSRLTAPSPDGKRTAVLEEFQPRGTIEGHIIINIQYNRHEEDSPILIGRVFRGHLGWLDKGSFVVIGSNLDIDSFKSNLYPDGTVQSKTRLIVCSREDIGCERLENKLLPKGQISISEFPEG